MNVVILKGNLTADPEVRVVGEKQTTVVNFSLAVSRPFKRGDGTRDKEVTFVHCEAWDSGAKTLAESVHKGSPLLIHGSLKEEKWEKDGKKLSRLKVRVKEFFFIGGKRPEVQGQTSSPEQTELAAAGGNKPF